MKTLMILTAALGLILTACTNEGSRIEDGFLGGISLSLKQSVVSASASTVATGGSVTISLSIKDQNGNLYYLPNKIPTVSFSSNGGTSVGAFGTVVGDQKGTYSVKFRGITSGTPMIITATVDGTQLDSSTTLQVTAPSPITGTFNGTQWDGTNSVLRLNSATNRSELDSSWAPNWSTLAGYWKMENNWNDSSGNSRNGSTLQGAPTFSSSNHKVGLRSGDFNGSSIVQINGTASNLSLKDFTRIAWIRLRSAPTMDHRIMYQQSGSYWIMGVNASAQIRAYDSATGDYGIGPSDVLAVGSWYHVAIVRDTAGGKFSIYINGALRYEKVYTDTTTYLVNGDLHIGGYAPGSTQYFDGQIDELGLWTSALSAKQIQAIYSRQSSSYSGQVTSSVVDASSIQSWTDLTMVTTLPFYKELTGTSGSESSTSYSSVGGGLISNLAGYFKFNGVSSASIANNATISAEIGSSGTAKNTNGTGMNYEIGMLNEGITLDGVDDYIDLGPNFDFTSQNFSISVWVKLKTFTTTSGGQGPIIFYKGNYQVKGYYSQVSSLGAIFFTTNQSSVTQQTNTATNAIALNTWTHITYTRSGSVVKIYVNGKDATTSSGSHLDPATSNSNFTIGSYGGSILASSSFDEASIWSRALSDNEVKELYRRGANRLKYQVRSCSASDCSDQDALVSQGMGWKGPDNSQLSYFSELYNTANNALSAAASALYPTLTLSNFAGGGLSLSPSRFIQYRAILESDDQNNLCDYGSGVVSCSPELKSFSIGPNQ